MVVKSFRYRLYPTKKQRGTLGFWLGLCRRVYNQTLEVRKNAWAERQEALRLYDTNKMLPEWKLERPELKQVHSQVLQNVQYRVDRAFQDFFRRLKLSDKSGYPRFRGHSRYDSFTFPQYPGGAQLHGSVLKIGKIGSIRLNLHRPIAGTIKTTTLRQTATGKWFVSFVVILDTISTLPPTNRAIGLDLGLESFLTSDAGDKLQNPRFFRSEEKAVAQVQRRLSAAPKGSARARPRKAVARVYERIKNRRSNFAHQVSRRLVNQYGVIVFEKLKPSNLVKNRRLAKSIQDAAWTQIRNYTAYKAEEAGRQVVLVNPAYTSQDCSRCSFRVKKKLSNRIHRCPACNLELDRDHNAAINILRLGLQSLAQAEKPDNGNGHES